MMPMMCEECGRALIIHAGYCEVKRLPTGEVARFCSIRCLHEWTGMRLGDAV